jgi:uncharacterized protein (TIGR03435 family)
VIDRKGSKLNESASGGLKLEMRKGPMEVIVVEHAGKTTLPN